MKSQITCWFLCFVLCFAGLLIVGCQASPPVLPTRAETAVSSIPGSDPSQASAPATPVTATATSEPPAGPPNIVLIVIDSLRADHVSAYGYGRATTTNLDTLIAADGMRFEHAISSASWTCPANAAIMSGIIPSRLESSWATVGDALPRRIDTLAEYLQDGGYYTAGFITNTCISRNHGFAQGFDVYNQDFLRREDVDAYNQVDAAEINALVLSWLTDEWQGTRKANKPLFLFVYYMDPHVVYAPPAPYDTLYDPTYDGPFTSEGFDVGQDVVAGLVSPSERDIEHIQALYDGEITYWDSQFAWFITGLENLGLRHNTLFIVTADHGELFGEHNKWVHGTALYEELIRVPLLMWYPGVIPSGTSETPVQTFDLMPTILDLADLPSPQDVDAVSLSPLFRGETLPARTIYSEVDAAPSTDHWSAWIAPDTDLRSVEREGWKLIYHVGSPAEDELYQLETTSLYERDNQIQAEAARAEQLRQEGMVWFARE